MMAYIFSAKKIKSYLLILCCFFLSDLSGQTVTVATGSFVVNMGVTPQTIGNGLKPYGMIYDLIKDYGVTIIWSIQPAKVKDGIDFSHNGIDYKGGTFIIPAEYRTTAVNSRITYWQGQGVVGATTVSPVMVPVYATYNLQTIPRWTLDKQNGSIAAAYFVNAGIPASAHGGSSSSLWKDPVELDCCDDLFVMPHADPVWATHENLYYWNDSCKGAIWAACHAVSALENMVNPANRNQQTNFLTQKDPNWKGTTGSYTLSNALVLWGSHSGGTVPYTHRLPGDPVAQYMGITDGAMLNGSEQIYIPRQGIVATPLTYSASAIARWNSSAKIIAYDPSQSQVTNPDLTTLKNVAAVMVYGRGFEDNNRGWVMYEAGHAHNKATAPDNIASQRAFFNFGFLVASEKGGIPELGFVPGTLNSNSPVNFTMSFPMGIDPNDYTIQWSTSCGGTFSPNATSQNVTYTPPTVASLTNCIISVSITDLCGRRGTASKGVVINPCNLVVAPTSIPVSCFGQSNGSISMVITGAPGPFSWNWSRVSPAGTGSGSGTTISGLSAGTYNITVSDGGSCIKSFTTSVSQPNLLTVVATPTNYLCFGNTGSINLTVNGGNPSYTYDWADIAGTNNPKDRSGLSAGTYQVTVTDTKGCTATSSSTITGPLMGITTTLDSKTNVSCNGGTNGAINISVSGGTPGYTYLWNDGNTSQDRSSLSSGTYTVTITDSNGCTGTNAQIVTQPAVLILSLGKTDPTCPPSASAPVNSNGSIQVTATGGIAPYNVSWTGTSSGNPAGNEIAVSGGSYTISGLTAGSYTVTLTDANGCIKSAGITLVQLNGFPSAPTIINNN